jgi:hypothetical protein
VGSVYDEFEEQLGAWQRQYAGRPQREIIRLLLLAPRTRGDGLDRLQGGPDSTAVEEHADADDVREIIRHALIWSGKMSRCTPFTFAAPSLELGSPDFARSPSPDRIAEPPAVGLHQFASTSPGETGQSPAHSLLH